MSNFLYADLGKPIFDFERFPGEFTTKYYSKAPIVIMYRGALPTCLIERPMS